MINSNLYLRIPEKPGSVAQVSLAITDFLFILTSSTFKESNIYIRLCVVAKIRFGRT